MKKCVALSIAVSLFFLQANQAAAEKILNQKMYAAVGYTELVYEESAFGYELDLSLGAVTGRFGGYLNKHISVEARVGGGVKEDDANLCDGGSCLNINLDLDTFYGIYGRFGMAANPFLYPYFMLGTTKISGTLSACGNGCITDDAEEDDMTYGVGADVWVSGTALIINAEYARMFDKDDVTIDAFSISLSQSF